MAQTTGSVSGKLSDAGNKPVSYATVTLLRNDSSVVSGDLSKDDGSFSITPVNVGSYLLRIESMGFATQFKAVAVVEDKPNVKLGTIKLAQTENTLKTVSITAEKAVMEMKMDKKVFNVEKNTTAAGGSATDILQNVPSVSVDADGTLSLRGKSNVTVLIDGKPATLLGSDVTSALQSLPASTIESVEIITNPSAKYDAQGTTGIINIVTKKDGKLGINGSVTAGAGTRDKYNGNLNLSIRKGKWSAFVNGGYRINRTFNNITTDRDDKAATNGSVRSYHTYEHAPRLFGGSFNSIGGTYDINKNNSITLTENINFMQFGFTDNSDYYIYDQPGGKGNTLLHRYRYSDALGGPVSLSTAFDYKKKFNKKGEELNVDATYATTTITRHQNYDTYIDTSGVGTPWMHSRSPGEGGNSSLNVWADYTDPILTTNGKLGLGFKSQFYDFNSKNDPKIWMDTVTDAPRVTDSSQYTVYNYSQQIHAAYINWNDQVGKFSYQLGLRGETAIYDGEGDVPRHATFHNEFTNLFPSAFVSYQLPANQSVYVNYSRRINRPNFFQLMPFKDLSNPGTVNMGNPNILPEFINNMELSYNRYDDKGNNFIISTYYSSTSNLSERIVRPITGSAEDLQLGLGNEIGQLLSMPVNIASGTTYGLEGTAKLQLTKIWDATLNANFFKNELKIGNANAAYSSFLSNNSGQSWFGKVNSNVKLPANFSLQFNGNYESPKIITQGRQRESYWLDVAVRKNLWKSKATLVVNCSDVFKTRRFITEYNTPSYIQTTNRVKETRIGNITFTYRFGKTDMGKGGPGAAGGPGKGGKREARRPEKPSDEDRGKNLKQNDDDNGGGGGQGGGGNTGGSGGQRREGR